jgi:tetratricopeptide (TPR) repeat protein
MALEALYAEGTKEIGEIAGITPDLARHFEEAGIVEKAVAYLQQAGKRAVRLAANEEAVAHFYRGLKLLESLPDTPERAQRELTLQLALAAPLQAVRGYSAPEVAQAMARARELCQTAYMDDVSQLFLTLWVLNNLYGIRAEYQAAIELGEQMLNLAQRAEDPLLIAIAHLSLGWVLILLGDFGQARDHLEHMATFYDPEQHSSLAFVYGADLGIQCLAWLAWVLWFLGYPDQALHRSQEALALARKVDHPFTLTFALGVGAAMVRVLRREAQAAQAYVDEEYRLAKQEGHAFYQAGADIHQGLALIEAGDSDEGAALLHRGMAGWEAIGGKTAYRAYLFVGIARAHKKAGRVEEGLNALVEALKVLQETGERFFEAELYRVKGELLLMQGDEADAENCFQQAIGVARRQTAKFFNLRASMSLCRLWQKQGKMTETRHMLEEIYGWFTEGFDTLDLKEAKALLDELSKG